jgi:tRNA threonylcarbamoyladenosine biosynthesis protein TsaB
MITLAVESATHVGSLALYRERSLIGTREWSREGSHSEFISRSLEELFNELNLKPQALRRVAVDIGPGSFTGIRVGVNFARSLAYALNIPVYVVSSLELLAAQTGPKTDLPILALEYGFRDIVYLAGFRRLDNGRVIATSSPRACPIGELSLLLSEPTVVVGSGFERLKNQIPAEFLTYARRLSTARDEVHARDFAYTTALDEGLILSTTTPPDESLSRLTDWIHTIPLYIRASEAEEKLKLNALKN